MADATNKTRICVVGGGATGLSLLWSLYSVESIRDQIEVTLFHNYEELGGHSYTYEVEFPNHPGEKYPVELGVQFVCPLLYPNLQKMVGLTEFDSVHLDTYPALNIASTFTETMNWGNFAAYQDQSNPLFNQCWTPAIAAEAEKFQLAVATAPLEGLMGTTLDEYFQAHTYSDHFKDYILTPYLSILNGYGGSQMMMQAKFEDLFPIFAPLSPGFQSLGDFTKPGHTWQRFRGGVVTWVDAMANYARGFGASINTGTPVTSVWKNDDGTLSVEWRSAPDTMPVVDVFDRVVLTTNMTVNRQLLDNEKNGDFYTNDLAPYISETKFPLKGGACYIHTDDGVFPDYMPKGQGRQETVQFTAYYAQNPPSADAADAADAADGTDSPPYDVSHTYSTYVLQHMVPGMPEPCYLSM